MIFNEKQAYNLLTLAAGIFLISIAVLSTGTGDDGDSVHHFLFAKYAFLHPENFFHHWAKPVYVMLAAPFAQFDFMGVKVLNALLLTFQIWILGGIARHFMLKNAWLLPIFSLVAPMNLTHTISGLTEPLFAVWLAGPLLLLLQNSKPDPENSKLGWAYFLWSFLPLVRSEGLVIFCPLVIFMILRGDWRWLPMLAVGHILIGLAGWPWHADPFWVVTQIPYANISDSAYGSGTWGHFFKNMPLIIGSSLSVLLAIGLFDGFLRLILSKKWLKTEIGRDEAWLVYAFFLAFFFAHTIFWALGIFNSFGLLRVFLGIMPCLVLIFLNGANRLFETTFLLIKNRGVQLALMAALPVFIAFRTWNRLSWEFDFGLSTQQLAVENAVKTIKADYPDLSKTVVFAEFSDVHRQLGVDFFDEKLCPRGNQIFTNEPIPENSIVVFDEWYMGQMGRLGVEKMRDDPRFVQRGSFGTGGKRWDDRQYIHVFYADSTQTGVAGLVFRNPLDSFGAEIAGVKCLKLDEKYPFSPGFSSRADAFKTGDNLVVSFEICQPDTSDFSGISMVFQLESMGQAYVYHNLDFKKELRAAHGGWKKFRFLEKMPDAKLPNDKLSIYLWNQHPNAVFVKNLEVRKR